MASLGKFSKEVARRSTRAIKPNCRSRGLQTCSKLLAAQNFTMPAMSPTMTEGNIASWKVKEGDSFAPGDVLLEIETDKATMDVEAQEDGKLAKIMQADGAKGIKVGTRIAVLAEADDDLPSLSLPAEDAPPPSQKQDSPPESPETPPSKPAAQDSTPSTPSASSSSGKARKQTYPLYPSIAQLLLQNNVPLTDADKIPASGPKGRLLKGDVLSYLGQIDKSYSAQQSARISRLGLLDLSNIQAAAPKKAEDATTKPESTPSTESDVSKSAEPEVPLDTEIAIPISLTAVISVQKRIQDTLGISLPLSTFLARATELANEDLPRSNSSKATADDLFNDVLGLNKLNTGVSRGNYIPQITALPPPSMTLPRPAAPRPTSQQKPKTADIYDILTGTAKPTKSPSPSPSSSSSPKLKTSPLPPIDGIMAGSRPGEATNLFSVSASKGEEKRARTFLERVKTILQVEPGRLVV